MPRPALREQKLCPVCAKPQSDRELVRHIKTEHVGKLKTITKEKLQAVHLRRCTDCEEIISWSGKNHTCPPKPAPGAKVAINSSCKKVVSTAGPSRVATRSSARISLQAGYTGSEHIPQATNATSTRTTSTPRRSSRRSSSLEPRLRSRANSAASADVSEFESGAQQEALRVLLSVSPERHTPTGAQYAGEVVQEPVPVLHGQSNPSHSAQTHYAAATVPKAARTAFSEVATDVIMKAVTSSKGGEEHVNAIQDLELLATRLLHNSNGSRRRKGKVQSNIKRYKKGDLNDPQPLSPAKKRAAELSIAKRVHRQLQGGNVTRAARALDAADIAEPTPEVVQQLADLHPEAEPPDLDCPETVAVQITRAQLKKVIKRLPKGSAPGPSGWTFEHIQAVAQGTEAGMDAVLALVNAILAGDLPEWEWFTASRLVPLVKKAAHPGTPLGVRPIAIGEVWARLVSMCAMAACPNIGPSLAPLQVGVGVRGGAQVLGHAIRAGVKAHPEDVTLQLDFKNAFNMIHRGAMLQAVASRAPQLLKFAQWTYQKASPLRLPGAPPDVPALWSKAGVRQGDPCGPLFFALTLQTVLETVQYGHELVRVISYLDDTFLQGPKEAVAAAYTDLSNLAAEIGLVMQPAKSTVYSPTTENATALANQLGFVVSKDGIMAAGCPIGTPAFVAERAKQSARKVVATVRALQDMDLPAQDKLLLLRKSLQLKVSHFARCADYEHIQEALHMSEQAVTSAVLDIIDREEAMVDIEQLQLPLKKGGVGVQCLTASNGLVCKAGFIAAAALTQEALSTGSESFQPFKGEYGQGLLHTWQQVGAECTCCGDCKCAEQEMLSLGEAFEAGTLPGLQHVMSQKVADRCHAELLHKYQALLNSPDTRAVAEQHLARLHSLQHSVATAWLGILPTKGSYEIDNDTVKSALRFQLGVSPGPPDQACFRCLCGYRGSDCHHAMTCDKMSGIRTVRHNHIQNTVQYGCKTAGLDSTLEPKERHLKHLQLGDEEYGKRGDILLSTLDDLINVDISITHPASATLRGKASRTPGAAAEARDKAKVRDHAKNGTPGYSFVPFSIETYGRLGAPADKLLKELADVAASTGACDRDAYLCWIKREISLSLIRGNSRVFRKFIGCLSRGIGVNYQQGDIVPVLD